MGNKNAVARVKNRFRNVVNVAVNNRGCTLTIKRGVVFGKYTAVFTVRIRVIQYIHTAISPEVTKPILCAVSSVFVYTTYGTTVLYSVFLLYKRPKTSTSGPSTSRL